MSHIARRPIRPILLSLVLVATGFTFQAAPTTLPIPRPEALRPQTAKAVTCATNPTFTGKLTQTLVNSGTPPTITRITSPDVYGWISNVDVAWSCTASVRYSAIAWNTTASAGTFDWGNLINSTSVPCNWAVGSTDYLKANSGSTCATSDSMFAMTVTLDGERVYTNQAAHTAVGQFSFAHSDCDTYHGAEPIKSGVTFSTSSTANRPDTANCDPITLDNTNTTQTVTYDNTPPLIAFDWPTAGGPTVVAQGNLGVQFDATDAVAGFGGTDDWDLQRQTAPVGANPDTCGTTWVNDASAGNLVSGTTNALDQVSQQQPLPDACYRWTLAARDQNGKVATTITSGIVRVDSGATLGSASWNTYETWDLGGGDGLSVNTGTGNLVVSHPIVDLPIRGGALPLSLTYNRHDTATVGMGPGWRLDVFRRLAVNPNGSVTFTDGDGARHTFTAPSGSPTVTYTRPASLYATLIRDTAATPDRFTLTYRDQRTDVFDELVTGTGVLTQIRDRFANTVALTYVGNNTTRISSIADPSGRTVAFGWDGSNRLTNVVDWANVAANGEIQASGTGNRTHRFFYDASSRLIGWAGPLNTADACIAGNPSPASYLTCIAYPTDGLDISKTQTATSLSGGALGTTTRTGATAVTTKVTFAGADVLTVRDAEEVAAATVGTTFSHPVAWQTQVVRRGLPTLSLDTTTRYTLAGSTADRLARIGTVARKLTGAPNGGWISGTTAYHGTYLIEPTSIVEDSGTGGLARTTTHEYTTNAGGLVLLSRTKEPLSGADQRWTDYVYNPNNDVTLQSVSLNGTATATVTKTCYSTKSNTCPTNETGLSPVRVIETWVSAGAVDDDTNVATDYDYDASGNGQLIRETRHNRSADGGTFDDRATEWQYGTSGGAAGQVTKAIVSVSVSSTYDTNPDPATNARTNLATTYGYDSAGNQAKVGDPRCSITQGANCLVNEHFATSRTFDALNREQAQRLPTSPTVPDCSPTPACRQSSSTFDEFGLVRLVVDFGGRVTATAFDRAGRAVETYEDTDGAGTAPAIITGKAGFDPSGRLLWSEDQVQANDPAGGNDPGRTEQTLDELGRVTKTTEAASSSPAILSDTTMTYDALGRAITKTVGANLGAGGAAQTTKTGYDIGGRETSVDDEFTCKTTTYDYRDLALVVIEGKVSGTPCTGTGSRTITNVYDGLGRQISATVTGGDILAASTFDSAGNARKTWSTSGAVSRVVETTVNPLDEPTTEYRYTDTSGALSGQTWARANRDAAGNDTDRCTWAASPAEWCHQANLVFANPQPTSASSSTYDARNKRISLYVPGLGETTYEPTTNYQVKGVFLPTASGKEHQTIYAYDGRNRLTSITEYICLSAERPVCTGGNIVSSTTADQYEYDGNDNRTRVTENNGAGAVSRYYCHDARNQLTGVGDTSTCTGNPETYAFDAAGNRTAATGRTFTYTSAGQLATCSGTACSPTFDADGRLTRITTTATAGTWTYAYDGESRLVSVCKSTTCGASITKVEFTYDGEGHRIRIVETPASGSATTTDFTYEGDRVVREVATTGSVVVTRTFTVDEAGAILKVAIVTTGGSTTYDGTYLVTWNGHGDALALSRINTDGTLTAVNRYTYSTWGTPTIRDGSGAVLTDASAANLHFRYLYVGRFDVQWDDFGAGLGLHYMHARHYSPEFGRFLQPDPAVIDANLYAYAGSSPVSKIDSSGGCAAALAPAWPVGTLIAGITCSPVIISTTVLILTVAVTSLAVKSDTIQESTASNNYQWGKAWERAVGREAWRVWSRNGFYVRYQVRFYHKPIRGRTLRILDVCVYSFYFSRPVVCYDAKTGYSYDYNQAAQDDYLMRTRGFPIIYIYGPGRTGRLRAY